MSLRLTGRVDLNVYYDAERGSASDTMLSVVTREVFAAFYANCPSVGFEDAGRPIGGVIFDGESAHIAVLPSHHGRWALLLGPTLSWLFSLKDEILLHTPADNAKALQFLEHCGWPRLGVRDAEVVHRLTAREVDARGLARRRQRAATPASPADAGERTATQTCADRALIRLQKARITLAILPRLRGRLSMPPPVR